MSAQENLAQSLSSVQKKGARRTRLPSLAIIALSTLLVPILKGQTCSEAIERPKAAHEELVSQMAESNPDAYTLRRDLELEKR